MHRGTDPSFPVVRFEGDVMSKRGLLLICIFSLLIPFAFHGEVFAREDARVFHILLLSSYNFSYSTVNDQFSGFRDGLGTLSYDIDYEFMDSKKFFTQKDLQEFYNFLNYKIRKLPKYDLIVLSDDNAFRFWRNYRQQLFQDTPVVFLGINNIADARRAAEDPNVTGIAEVADYASNYELIHALFPDRKKVVAIVDSSITGIGEYALYVETSEQYPDFTYSVINTGNYSQNGLISALQKLGKDTCILYLDFLEDADGNIYTERTASTLVSENAPGVPIFRISTANMGYGVLGGLIYSHYEAGKKAGEMALQISEGVSPADIPLVDTPFTTPIFDQSELDKYEIKKSALPENAVILNEHWSLIKFYSENVLLANMIVLVILLLISFIAFLFYMFWKRDQLTKEDFLTKMPNRLYINERLKRAVEKRDPFGVIMMDVDHFKTINDTLGHPVGDELLISVANRLKSLSSKNLLIARIGGDEFMAIILGKRIADADAICSEIQKKMKLTHALSTGPMNITASIGCALYPENTDDPDKVLHLADEALYEIKEAGRDGYKIFEGFESGSEDDEE